MSREAYRLTEAIAGFPEGEVLDVTARFGDWHMTDFELEPRRKTPRAPRKLVVTDAESGFTEAEILDETARFGDWHEYELAFEPVPEATGGRTRVTRDDLESVAERVEPPA